MFCSLWNTRDKMDILAVWSSRFRSIAVRRDNAKSLCAVWLQRGFALTVLVSKGQPSSVVYRFSRRSARSVWHFRPLCMHGVAWPYCRAYCMEADATRPSGDGTRLCVRPYSAATIVQSTIVNRTFVSSEKSLFAKSCDRT